MQVSRVAAFSATSHGPQDTKQGCFAAPAHCCQCGRNRPYMSRPGGCCLPCGVPQWHRDVCSGRFRAVRVKAALGQLTLEVTNAIGGEDATQRIAIAPDCTSCVPDMPGQQPTVFENVMPDDQMEFQATYHRNAAGACVARFCSYVIDDKYARNVPAQTPAAFNCAVDVERCSLCSYEAESHHHEVRQSAHATSCAYACLNTSVQKGVRARVRLICRSQCHRCYA
jgi:hypothetical protein